MPTVEAAAAKRKVFLDKLGWSGASAANEGRASQPTGPSR